MWEMGNKDIKEGKRIIRFNLHGELNVLGDTIEMGKKSMESREAMSPNNKSVIDKLIPTFWLLMPIVAG
jgi:hypothetical protein